MGQGFGIYALTNANELYQLLDYFLNEQVQLKSFLNHVRKGDLGYSSNSEKITCLLQTLYLKF